MKTRKPSCVTLLCLIVALVAQTSFAKRRERLIDAWKPLHYSVAITLNRELNEITRATTEITLTILRPNVSEIDLDFGELPIDTLSVNGRHAKFSRDANLLRVRLTPVPRSDRSLTITIGYHGRPKDGLVLTNDKDGTPSAIGDNWPNRVHHWIPVLDHPSAKASVTFTITAPDNNIVVANGGLVRVKEGGMTRTWTYNESAPIPPYCMIFAAGQFAEIKSTDPAITPLAYYVPQTDAAFAAKGFGAAAPSLKLFSETVAPYPYEKLALIVGATQFGGMENSGAIVFASNLFTPRADAKISPTFGVRKGIVEVTAHEIAHQWFGDSVTESTWSDLWLSEGFATYFAGVFLQKHEGEAAFREYMKEAADQVLQFEQQQRLPLHDTETEDLFKLLNANNYQKGAWVLHMLRAQLGDDVFFRGIRDYYTAHKGGTASSEDLRRALEKASGLKLQTFFASWVYGTGHPIYDITWSWHAGRKVLVIKAKQKQQENLFPNAIPVKVVTSTGESNFLLQPTTKEFVQEFPMPSAPTSVAVDPENTVLKQIEVRGSVGVSARAASL